jgi:hypothetical protein
MGEARLANVSRDAAWAKLGYKNQMPALCLRIFSVLAGLLKQFGKRTEISAAKRTDPTLNSQSRQIQSAQYTGAQYMKCFTRLSVFLMILMTGLHAQENYSQWSHYRTLILNTTGSGGGAGVPGNVTGFPLLVRLTSAHADVFAQSKAGGADLRFTKANGVTRLAHEIDQWDSAGLSAAIWVRLDTATGNTNAPAVRLYWGNAAAADSSSGASVFRTADNYQGVWHFGGNFTDATSNANNGSNTGSVDTAGAMGRGRYFNGTSNSISIPNTATMNAANPLTVEAWVNWQTIGTGTASRYRPVISHGDGNSGNQFFLYARNPSSGTGGPYYSFGYYTGSVTNDAQYATDVPADAQTWVHLTGTYDGTTWVLYRNGVLVGSAARSGTPVNATTPWYIGAFGGASTSRWYHGSLDEVRFSNAVRDSNWVRLTYETQKAGASALQVGTTQANGAPVAVSNLRYVPANTATNDTIIFQTGVSYNIVPTYTGGPVDSFAIASGGTSWPTGITLNKFTGALTGTPTATIAVATRTITAYGTAGNAFRAVVRSAVLGPTMSFRYNPDTTVYTAGLPVTNTPTFTGRAPTAFSVAPALPAGISLNATTGVISGTPAAATAIANYTVTATNTTGPDTATRVLRLTIGAAETYSAWAQHRTLWLNTQGGNGAGTTALVQNFPVLVRLGAADSAVFTQSFGQGADLRFTKTGDVTRLPHEIEQWDSAGRAAAVWVLVDSVKANDRVQTIRMHWSRAGSQNVSNGPSVFDTARGFVGVWHLSGTGDAADATANGFTATNTGSPPSVTGLLGPGRSFNGTSQYFIVANNDKLNITQNLTISAWVNAVDWEGSRYIVAKATGMNASSQYGLRDNSTGGLILETANTSAGIRMDNPSAAAWHLITGTYGGGFGNIYLDGTVVTSVASAANLTTTTQTVGIGRRNTGAGADHWFAGIMDEVRIQNALRDSNWIRLEYENQKANQSLVWTTQPPVGIAGSSAAREATFGFTAKALGDGMLFRIDGTEDARRARVALVDMWGRTVWSHTATTAAGMNQVLWNGQANNGSLVSSGVYVVRVSLFDARNKVTATSERRVPLTR